MPSPSVDQAESQPSPWSQRKVAALGWLFVLAAAIGLPILTLRYASPQSPKSRSGRTR